MIKVIGVRFRQAGKIYYFDPLDLDIEAVRDMYAYYDFDMTIRDSDIAAMQSTVQFMLDSGMIEESVDISSIVRR